MLKAIKNFLGLSPAVDFKKLIAEGAIVVDVRSKGEYHSGHFSGSLNIPLDQFNNIEMQLKDKNQSIITCCASGIRSAAARKMLLRKNYRHVYNAGPWTKLQDKN